MSRTFAGGCGTAGFRDDAKAPRANSKQTNRQTFLSCLLDHGLCTHRITWSLRSTRTERVVHGYRGAFGQYILKVRTGTLPLQSG